MAKGRQGSSAAGSHAGRGFHYQDAVAASLAIRAWSGEAPFTKLIPEGRDDCEVQGQESAFVQAKSRRGHLGPFPLSTVAKYIRALWDRYEKAATKPDHLVLSLERDVEGLTLGAQGPFGGSLNWSDFQPSALRSDPRHGRLFQKTRIQINPSPMEDAIRDLTRLTDCRPIVGQLYYGEVLRQVVRLADGNGAPGMGTRHEGLAPSDVQATLEGLRELALVQELDEALAAGVCEVIDFLTPVDDPDFYLGVDVKPGHLAAGLTVERPEARDRVIEALETPGLALVAGPSGSGKSAVMWEAARFSRHTIRWFRIRRLGPAEVHLLVRMARALRASAEAPVGFIFDDVGAGLAAGWDALAREPLTGSAIRLLGSIRQEDLFLVAERHRARELRELGSDDLAERIWQELRRQGKTTWTGWREPWARSDGLLLEYAGVLTQGKRLEQVLRDQVSRRVTEERDTELALLRLVSLAGAAGATALVDRLPAAIGETEDAVARALRRLIDEHLLRETSAGRLGGLHQLRSEVLANVTHETPPPTVARSLERAVAIVAPNDLEPFLARSLSRQPEAIDSVLEALAHRFGSEADGVGMAAALRGLGQVQITSSIDRWAPSLEALGVPPTQVTTAVMFAIGEISLAIPQLAPVEAAARRLERASANDPRLVLLAKLPPGRVLTILRHDTTDAACAVLEALVGAKPSAELIAEISHLEPRLADMPLGLVRRLLEAAQVLSRDIAQAWVAATGQDELLERVATEWPWAIDIRFLDGASPKTVHGRICQVVAEQQDLNEEVVELCAILLALAPDAELADCAAIAADGQAAGLLQLPLAVKQIARADLPPAAVTRWNRRWSVAAAERFAPASTSDYLSTGFELLSKLVPALEKAFDQFLRRGTILDPVLEGLGDIHEASRSLTAPTDHPNGPLYVTRLQAVLFDASADLLRRFAGLPNDAAMMAGWLQSGLRTNLPKVAEEPWDLIDEDAGPLLARLQAVVDAVILIAADANAGPARPVDAWRATAKQAPLGQALRAVARALGQRAESERNGLARDLCEHLRSRGLAARVELREDREFPLPWPSAEILLLLEIDDLAQAELLLAEAFCEAVEVVGEIRQITVAPHCGGVVVGAITLAGRGQFFPAPEAADAWAAAAGAPTLTATVHAGWQALLNSLAELDTARVWRLGADGRPAVEREAISAARAQVGAGLEALQGAMGPEHAELFDELAGFVDDVLNARVDLGQAIANTMHGAHDDVLDRLQPLVAPLIEIDLDRWAADRQG